MRTLHHSFALVHPSNINIITMRFLVSWSHIQNFYREFQPAFATFFCIRQIFLVPCLGLLTVTCGHPVVTRINVDTEDTNGIDSSVQDRQSRQDGFWTGSSDITAVLKPTGQYSAVAKPLVQSTAVSTKSSPTTSPSSSKVIKKSEANANTRAPGSEAGQALSGLSGSSPGGNAPSRVTNSAARPNQTNQPGGSQGQNKNNGSNKRKNNKPKPANSKESSEEDSDESYEDNSSQESGKVRP